MKAFLYIVLIIIIASLTSINSLNKHSSKKYLFKNSFEYSSIELFDNGTFYQTKKSCTYAFTCTGNWTQNDDKILLNQEKFKKTSGNYIKQAKQFNQLLILGEESAVYSWYKQKGFSNSFVMHLQH